MARRGPSEQYALSDQQIEALLAVCETLEDKVLIKSMLYMGLRASEVGHLNAQWLDGQGNIKVPPRQPCDCSECKGEWKPKTSASIRTVPIPKIIREDLLELLALHREGLKLHRSTIWQRVKRLLKKAGIKSHGPAGNTAYPHALRATCATLLAKGGMSAVALCYYMGWADLKVGDHYIKLSEAKEGAITQARKIFG